MTKLSANKLNKRNSGETVRNEMMYQIVLAFYHCLESLFATKNMDER